MDQRLLVAARTGNVDHLLELFKGDPTILEAVVIAGGDTPLHIASMAGHLNFVREVVKLSETCARELNQDGFTPLHLATAMGHTEVVRELLRVRHDICLIKGRHRRIPLHYAAIKGRVQVMDELLSACADSVDDVTARGETALHLAVKSYQFDAFKILVEHLNKFNKIGYFEKEGCPRQYHLAPCSLQETVRGSRFHVQWKNVVEINAVNSRGLTALDVLLLFQNEAGDWEFEEILRGAGAMRALDMENSAPATTHQHQTSTMSHSSDRSASEPSQSSVNYWQEYFKYRKERDSPNDVRNILLVIAILIVTTTYQAVLSPPGGVWQEDYLRFSNNNNTTSKSTADEEYFAGTTIMGSKNWLSYTCFLFFNSIGFFTSLQMITFLTNGIPFQWELQVSLTALALTYDFSMAAIAPNYGLMLFFIIISVVMPLVIARIPNLVRNYLKK